MSSYRLTALAQGDILAIWTHIYEENPDAADAVEEAIYRAFELVSQMPHAGHLRSDLTKRQVRFWNVTGFPSYLVVYRSDKTPVQILRVLHGARNLGKMLR
jgi:plasmid stabilization system protein ParE